MVFCYELIRQECLDADQGIKPLHRSREFQAEQRWKKKALTKTTWYRPFDAAGFMPPTPGGVLAKQIQDIVTQETARIKMSAKIVESGGTSLKQHLVKTDLTGCFNPDCYLCESGTKGGSQTRSGVHYSGIWRTTKFHKEDIKKNNLNNAFAKHMNIMNKSKI